MHAIPTFAIFFLCFIANAGDSIATGITSSYVRRLESSQDMPMDADVFRPPRAFNAPQQVHITQGDQTGRAVIVSWITPYKLGSNVVHYGLERWPSRYRCIGLYSWYTFYNYTSGFIHHCNLTNLRYNTKYYYRLESRLSARVFWFVTPPEPGPDVPYTFGIIGDLGQTFDSNATLHDYLRNQGEAVLYVGDLSYADNYPFYDSRRWDTWGRFIERSAAYEPWLWTIGNHEIEYGPDFGETEEFKVFNHRFMTPYTASGSSSPLWYSVKRGPAHIIVLSSYSGFVLASPQWIWLRTELGKVDRSKTPWLIVLVHISFYSSNSVHYLEGESMRSVFEPWFVQNKVDVVFAGHVHAYERTFRVTNINFNLTNGDCEPVLDEEGPVYLVVGDGGNIQGLALPYTQPQPLYSAFREASFGHAIFEIRNRTHAYFRWHRNQDGVGVVADSFLFLNQYWKGKGGGAYEAM